MTLATCAVVLGINVAWGYCGLQAGFEREGHPVCRFHYRFGGKLPFHRDSLPLSELQRRATRLS